MTNIGSTLPCSPSTIIGGTKDAEAASKNRHTMTTRTTSDTPTMQNKTLTNAQIKMQNAFIVHLAKTAGIKWNQNAKSLTSGNGYEAEFLQHLSDVAAKPCGCGECFQSSVAGLFNPIAGFDEPMAEYFVPRSQDSMCYGYFLRIRDLLEKHQNSGDKNTRMHYALLLRQIKNALNR